MTTFIKVCPKCGQHNPEYENACSVCTHFIGMETPVRTSNTRSDHVAPEPSIRAEALRVTSNVAPPTASATGTESTAPAQTLYLQVLNTDQIFEIYDGSSVGQAHPSSDASLQLRDLAGIEYVHRKHCKFAVSDGAWQVTPIDQRHFGRDFTNSTSVNQFKLTPGLPHTLKNGDQLSLALVKFVVRII